MVLRLLAERLERVPDITVGVFTHPQSNLADGYRELGEIFAVGLQPHNRWGGFKALRERWQAHLEHTLLRPVLLIDEAQELSPTLLCELRLLASARFDSRLLLSIVLCGDRRLAEKLRREELVPLGSRIRTRLAVEYASGEELAAALRHLLGSAGNAQLLTPELQHTLCEHALGNFRVLTTMGAELWTPPCNARRPNSMRNSSSSSSPRRPKPPPLGLRHGAAERRYQLPHGFL